MSVDNDDFECEMFWKKCSIPGGIQCEIEISLT
jgi:hypothetical protein